MPTIIAPTDFSDVSLNAVNYAADLARDLKTSLYLLHVFQIPVIFSEVPVAFDYDASIKKAEERLFQLSEDIIRRTAGEVRIYKDMKIGSVLHEIINVCDVMDPGYIVMGTHETGFWEKLLSANNTISAMKRLLWPLIIVPSGAKYNDVKKIGFACDLKEVPETVPLEQLEELVRNFRADLHIIHVETGKEFSSDSGKFEEYSLLRDMLVDLNPTYHFLNGDIDKGLRDYAEKEHLDLLVVIPKKHNIVEAIFNKSRTKQLISQSNVPVLSVRERE